MARRDLNLALAIANAAFKALEYERRHAGMRVVGENLNDGLFEGYLAIKEQVDAIGQELLELASGLKDLLKSNGISQRVKVLKTPEDALELLDRLPMILGAAQIGSR